MTKILESLVVSLVVLMKITVAILGILIVTPFAILILALILAGFITDRIKNLILNRR